MRASICAFGIALFLLAAPTTADEISELIARAESGDVIDQQDLASAYYFGRDVEQSFSEAYVWYSMAVDGGLEDAAERRDKAAAQLDPEQLEHANADLHSLKSRLVATTD